VQEDKPLDCTSCLFILAYNDKYTHNYLTVPTSRLITLTLFINFFYTTTSKEVTGSVNITYAKKSHSWTLAAALCYLAASDRL